MRSLLRYRHFQVRSTSTNVASPRNVHGQKSPPRPSPSFPDSDTMSSASSFQPVSSSSATSALVRLSKSLKLMLRLHMLLAESTRIASQLVDYLVDADSQAPAQSSCPATPPGSPRSQVMVPQFLTTRVVNEVSRKIAALDFNPNGPFSLFVPGGLTLDGHVQNMYNGFLYDIPDAGATGQLYAITRGRRVGIFATWARASPHVSSLKNAVYIKVCSVEDGEEVLLDCIDKGIASWLRD